MTRIVLLIFVALSTVSTINAQFNEQQIESLAIIRLNPCERAIWRYFLCVLHNLFNHVDSRFYKPLDLYPYHLLCCGSQHSGIGYSIQKSDNSRIAIMELSMLQNRINSLLYRNCFSRITRIIISILLITLHICILTVTLHICISLMI
jgi:uncharacterized membrane protein AbrB (regulator of aidB expression)